MNLYRSFAALTKFEWTLWLLSVAMVAGSFILGTSHDLLTLTASLTGVTALIFVAKGDVLGQILTVVFSLLYGAISYQLQYYGEMITYLGMTAPIALMSVVSWLKHPYQAGKPEVKVARLGLRQWLWMMGLTIIVTVGFHFVLAWFHTANLAVSTISIATSFLASYLMFLRSAAYALAYAANDVVLIVLWGMASTENMAYLPVVICFLMFFCNDIYGYFNWKRISRRQKTGEKS